MNFVGFHFLFPYLLGNSTLVIFFDPEEKKANNMVIGDEGNKSQRLIYLTERKQINNKKLIEERIKKQMAGVDERLQEMLETRVEKWFKIEMAGFDLRYRKRD